MGTLQPNDPCLCGSGKKFKNCCLLNLPANDGDTQIHSLQEKIAHAYKLMSEQKWDEAINEFKHCLDEAPDSTEILQAIGGCYDGSEDYLRASEYYEKALTDSNDPRRPHILYQLGVSRACAGRIQKAREAFDTSLDLFEKPQEKDAIKKILAELAAIESGKKTSQSFLAQAQLQRAFSDFEAEDYEQAAVRLEKVSRLDPENSAVFYNLGVAYAFLNREDAALACFERTVELDEEYVTAYYNMGQIYLIRKRDFSRALNCFDKAIAFRQNYIGAHHQKGLAYELLGDADKAIQCWRKTLEFDPNNKQALENIDRVQNKHS